MSRRHPEMNLWENPDGITESNSRGFPGETRDNILEKFRDKPL